MQRQVEGAPVHRQQRAAAEHLKHLQRVLGAEVDIAPALVKGTDFQHHQIEGTMAPAGVLEDFAEAGVAGEEDLAALRLHDPRRPQRAIAIAHAAPRKC